MASAAVCAPLRAALRRGSASRLPPGLQLGSAARLLSASTGSPAVPPPPGHPAARSVPRPPALEQEDVLASLRAHPQLAAPIVEHILYSAEMRGALPPEARRRFLARALDSDELREEFRRADADKDGRISWKEFAIWGEQLVAESGRQAAPPSRTQLFWFFVRSALPFVGFGCVDNGLMVLTGEAIDSTLGVVLGISTMAAAALGNATSNVLGMGAHGTIEKFVSKLGVPNPRLSPEQLRSPRVHSLKVLGGAIGVFAGCLLGMAPLLFLNSKKRDEADAAVAGAAAEP